MCGVQRVQNTSNLCTAGHGIGLEHLGLHMCKYLLAQTLNLKVPTFSGEILFQLGRNFHVEKEDIVRGTPDV